MKSIIIKLVISVVMLLPLLTTTRTIQWNESSPVPTPWPKQFHALLFMNLTSSGHLQVSNLWYDWPSGKNVNIIQKQLGVLLYDVEWDNGTSFYYTLTPGGATVEYYCEIMHFEVGILRPNWLDGATYLGTQYTDGFLCNVWEKVDFIVYYEDVVTNTPVRWDFYDGISTHVMTYEVGAVLEDSQVQAPSYCFGADKSQHVNRDGLPKFDTRKLHLKSSSNI